MQQESGVLLGEGDAVVTCLGRDSLGLLLVLLYRVVVDVLELGHTVLGLHWDHTSHIGLSVGPFPYLLRPLFSQFDTSPHSYSDRGSHILRLIVLLPALILTSFDYFVLSTLLTQIYLLSTLSGHTGGIGLPEYQCVKEIRVLGIHCLTIHTSQSHLTLLLAILAGFYLPTSPL